MALEAGGKCEWVLGHYLILRKTCGLSFFLFLFLKMFGKKQKTSGSLLLVVYFILFYYFQIFKIKEPQVLAFSKTLKEPMGL
jgi:hypothetical protein